MSVCKSSGVDAFSSRMSTRCQRGGVWGAKKGGLLHLVDICEGKASTPLLASKLIHGGPVHLYDRPIALCILVGPNRQMDGTNPITLNAETVDNNSSLYRWL